MKSPTHFFKTTMRLFPWWSPGEGRGKHENYLVVGAVLCLVTQPCPTLCKPLTVARQTPLSMGILQARIPEWVAILSSSLNHIISKLMCKYYNLLKDY